MIWVALKGTLYTWWKELQSRRAMPSAGSTRMQDWNDLSNSMSSEVYEWRAWKVLEECGSMASTTIITSSLERWRCCRMSSCMRRSWPMVALEPVAANSTWVSDRKEDLRCPDGLGLCPARRRCGGGLAATSRNEGGAVLKSTLQPPRAGFNGADAGASTEGRLPGVRAWARAAAAAGAGLRLARAEPAPQASTTSPAAASRRLRGARGRS